MTGLFFLGNHSSCHCGSAAVWSAMTSACQQNKFENSKDIDSAEIVIVNGEGSMHHNRKGFQQKFGKIIELIDKGKEVYLVNTVWQENLCEMPDMLRMPNRIVVRECLSAMDLLKDHGVCPLVAPDIACFAITPQESVEISKIRNEIRSGSPKIATTDFYSQEYKCWLKFSAGKFSEHTFLDMKKMNWLEFVAAVAQFDLIITGRHHAICACLVAKVPFLPIRSNTHKIEGILKSSNASIPISSSRKELERALSMYRDGLFDTEYLKAFEWLQGYSIYDALPMIKK